MGVDAVMCVVSREKFSDDEICALSWQIGAAFGTEAFYFTYPQASAPRMALQVVEEEFGGWDSDQRLVAPAGGMLLRVNLTDRYWGPGYERGNLPQLLAIAKWLEVKTGGDVWYGGDSSGAAGEKLDAEKREALWKHFLEKGNPYFQREASFNDAPAPPCPLCRHAASNCGGGRGKDFWICCGCGWRAITSTAGVQPLGWGLGAMAFSEAKTAAEVIARRVAKQRT